MCVRIVELQVPCNLREGDTTTYEDVGSTRVWIAGNKDDDGKRFCTLQIIVRMKKGDPSKPRNGQPKMAVVFRGQGKRIRNEEKQAWHKDVKVYFQPKAWFDEQLCVEYARTALKEVCEEAKRAGRESVIIVDNLSGQTSEAFLAELRKHKAKRHLLPTGVTDELQLVDDGVGVAVKRVMGELFDEWAMQGDNLDRWTADANTPDIRPMAAWEKRVLITQLAGQAWERVCRTFNFEGAATRLGMLMTVDGSGDNLIKIQGIPDYSFTDEDGGEAGRESDDEDDDDIHADVDEGQVENEGETREEGGEGGDDEFDDEDEYEGGEDESDQELDDDTGDGMVRSSIGNAVVSDKYKIIEECPPVDTRQKRQQLIGKYVLVGWDTDDVSGWFVGKIHSANVGQRDLQTTPSANFVVKYTSRRTNDMLDGLVACELSERTHGVDKWWVLLTEV